MRNMLLVCVQNKLKFRFVLFDTWFSSKENMGYIKKDLVKDFICVLKSNRLAAVSEEDYQANRFTPIEELPWQEGRVVTQNNHAFAVLYAVFKLECLSIKRHLNHFALRAHLYLKAIRVAFDELQALKAA